MNGVLHTEHHIGCACKPSDCVVGIPSHAAVRVQLADSVIFAILFGLMSQSMALFVFDIFADGGFRTVGRWVGPFTIMLRFRSGK